MAILIIVVWALSKEDEDKGREIDMISSLAITSIGISSLATIGSLVESTDGLPIIQSDILLYIVAITVIFCIIWIFSKE